MFAIESEALRVFTGFTVVTVLYLLASAILVASNRTVDRNARRAFLFLLVSLAVVSYLDWFNVLTEGGHPELRTFQVVSTALTFSIAPFFPLVLGHIILQERTPRILIALLVTQILLEVATMFGGYVFWVDEANVYHRGPLYLVYIAVYSISTVYLAVQSVRIGRSYQSANFAEVVAILACLFGGVGMQLMDGTVRTTWPTVAMVVMLYFQLYCEMILRTDALTMLLNRHSYEEFLSNPPLPCTVVLIDVDEFKQVNDTYGHSFGDVCLQSVARLIRHAYGHAGLCYRTGGDEFAVVLKDGRQDPMELTSALMNSIGEARLKEPRLPWVSVGYAHADAGCKDIAAVVNEADEQMYQIKRRRKQERQING